MTDVKSKADMTQHQGMGSFFLVLPHKFFHDSTPKILKSKKTLKEIQKKGAFLNLRLSCLLKTKTPAFNNVGNEP
jgi:hypothetical protein